MGKVLTDEKLIDLFLTRGVEAVYPTTELLRQKLMSGARIRVYQGFDPTGPYLHVGHAMGIRAMSILQKLGHEVIFLVGDFTARVGDPDKDKTRDFLTAEQVEHNMNEWKKQAAQLIDFDGENPVQFKHNFDWLSQLKLENIIELMSMTTVQQMMERDLFAKRLQAKEPIQLREFIYPLLQGFDAVNMEVDLQMGGTDQTFNMLFGRDMVKRMLNKELFVRTNELMEAPDARTMSKSKGNGINLGDTANDMYGKAMSYPDELIFKALRLLTDVSLEDIAEMQTDMDSGKNPMTYKKIMSFEVVKVIKGKKSAEDAQKHFENTVQHGQADEENAEDTKVAGDMSIFEFLKNVTNGKESASQIKRMIEQGGVELNGSKIIQPDIVTTFSAGDVVKFGKRKFYKICE
ncbi:tyrosine--tRNA ligase [candidate division WWE3 bacterium RIFOXYC1_FULL_40_10]|nr:MAG: tyrosine--tRNA ligase [candidate division WWE3 bacterium RIFOXYB1_FULL_40_22]OGC61520.1 MAG: tyrosine--tRNA ligase [candidate division WWE3 bacterium RIFOXYA1_FULL_40_11]OGC64800.1 MAG: tyrosine--tRNA ligase [candidate division WWE3 bacterium RIFOXYB2_FULL_41_6]OGC65903.1 MAG: tyrosine--tRNA ligase [candidate division WWE3 bacterium RIFOXYC1_FULL_40_10]OGC67054.1 MAG: tyrosine--tRNA ligase [candidate division WWE3 bacterium RIFOXYC2_FULL_40_11]OGC71141.1 MAG: tyrosine--tRNA ligase [can